MQTAPLPLTKDIVLIGGGHAHALVALRWAMEPLAGAHLTIIAPDPVAAYSGMLPGLVAGHYRIDELEIDLVRLARAANARLILDRATGIDRLRREVILASGRRVSYDIASIDVGITTEMPGMPGFARHAVPAKPLEAFAAAWGGFLQQARGRVDVAVIGAGVAGVELALAMDFALKTAGAEPRVVLVQRGQALPGMGPGARRALLAHLARAGVELVEDGEACEVTADGIRLADGRAFASRFTLGAGGARPQDWLRETGLALHEGYVSVGPTLQSLTDPSILAVGDCAHLSHAPRPKAGVYAVREAPILFDNLRALAMGRKLRAYRPQRDYLKLISTGHKGAVADKWGLPLDGRWLWRWKDRIDRRFMAMFRNLPQMAVPPLPARHTADLAEALGDKPLCGGCGAKMASTALAHSLTKLPAVARPDLLAAPGDDAAILGFGAQRQVLTTDHLRSFWCDPGLVARIAAVHALGDIWAMGAAPQVALAQIVLPRLSETLQERYLTEIMQAAGAVFAAEGAAIAGGHTTIGDELTIGFTVTGLSAAPVRQSGARPGDALILTKRLGTGVILAAEMQSRAHGRHVAACLAGMAAPQGKAAALLTGAHAMTDVTGFGLAGHLMNICEASGIGAELWRDRLPVYDGAEALLASGERSSIHPANRAAVAARLSLPPGDAAEILFDPQTAGGLLVAVAPEAAADLVERLRATGVPAVQIGVMTDWSPGISVLATRP